MPSTSSSARPYHSGDDGRDVRRLAPRRSPPRGFGGAGRDEGTTEISLVGWVWWAGWGRDTTCLTDLAYLTNLSCLTCPSCSYRLLFREFQAVRAGVDHHGIALEEIAFEHAHRQ